MKIIQASLRSFLRSVYVVPWTTLLSRPYLSQRSSSEGDQSWWRSSTVSSRVRWHLCAKKPANSSKEQVRGLCARQAGVEGAGRARLTGTTAPLSNPKRPDPRPPKPSQSSDMEPLLNVEAFPRLLGINCWKSLCHQRQCRWLGGSILVMGTSILIMWKSAKHLWAERRRQARGASVTFYTSTVTLNSKYLSGTGVEYTFMPRNPNLMLQVDFLLACELFFFSLSY